MPLRRAVSSDLTSEDAEAQEVTWSKPRRVQSQAATKTAAAAVSGRGVADPRFWLRCPRENSFIHLIPVWEAPWAKWASDI